jgi:tripartite-type tricarboxylate transporter receptor subunit TctC
MSMRSILAIALVTTAGLASTGHADPVANFYAGKTITLIISTGVGGGVDNNARIVARHLGKHIPGNPTIVPKNMTGAGHLLAANYLYEQAPKDGLTIGAIHPAIVGYQVLDGRGAKYDVRKFNFLGSSDVENANLYVWRSTGIKSIEDVKSREVLMGATGAGSSTMLYPNLMNNTLGTKFKIIAGYKSTNEIHLAMERGEVSGRAGNLFSSLEAEKPEWIRDHKIEMLVQFGSVRDPAWANVPLLTDLATNEEERSIFAVFSAELALGKVFMTTPGVPADRLSALRKGFEDTLRDPAFIEDESRAGLLVRPLTHAKAKEIAERVVNLPPQLIEKAKASIEMSAADQK